MELSSHQIEKIGEAYVAEKLYREGIKFARPDIDEGIDLIVYTDCVDEGFRALPLQLKSFSGEEFFTDQKYLKIPDLYIVYLWNVGTELQTRAFGMPYSEAEKIVDDHGWSRKNGRYVRTRGTSTLHNALVPFEIKSWRSLFWDRKKHKGRCTRKSK